ncbi:MAG: ATP-binding cassette domain-containing protein [Candidatus Woesearchaeota archaeon]
MPDPEEAINLLIEKGIKLPSKKKILDLEVSKLIIEDKVLSNDIKLIIKGNERVAITGRNGSGKTVLLKKILESLKNTSGISVGYFPQNYDEILNYEHSSVEILQDLGFSMSKVMTMLGCLKFTSDEMKAKIKYLSEGQKAKVLIIKLILEKSNVLVMDEPTRNLSAISNPVIRRILKQFNGAIICVSHDRKFIHEVCSKTYRLTNEGLFIID